jgi:hypothetical protein
MAGDRAETDRLLVGGGAAIGSVEARREGRERRRGEGGVGEEAAVGRGVLKARGDWVGM